MPAVSPVAAMVIGRLAAAGCIAAPEEADELIAAAPDPGALEEFVARREQGEPLAWITGMSMFCGQQIRVDRDVYVPRAQSEELAVRAGELVRVRGLRASAVDLCTGSGAIAVHLMTVAPDATIIGVDVDERAASCARGNGVTAVVGDLGRSFAADSFDVVTAVAPYVPSTDVRFLPRDVQRYEPRRTLDGGPDGLELVRRVVLSAAELLRPDGWLLVEIGGDQDREIGPTLRGCGFVEVTTWGDEDGDLRGVAARLAATR